MRENYGASSEIVVKLVVCIRHANETSRKIDDDAVVRKKLRVAPKIKKN